MPILTCSNHPTLRWRCKEMAWSEGRYNFTRNLFFFGEVYAGSVTGFRDYYWGDDGAPVEIPECSCGLDSLILAPE
jgi:hypothetical protein